MERARREVQEERDLTHADPGVREVLQGEATSHLVDERRMTGTLFRELPLQGPLRYACVARGLLQRGRPLRDLPRDARADTRREPTARGQRGEDRLAGNRYDLILCDLVMPLMPGMDLHDELTRVDPASAAAMIFLTGGTLAPDAQRVLDRVPNLLRALV